MYQVKVAFHCNDTPNKTNAKNIPKAAGLKICLFWKRIKYLEIIANTQAEISFQNGSPLEITKPVINPVIIALSVICNEPVLKYRKIASVAKAEMTATKAVNKNIKSLFFMAKNKAKLNR